MICSGWQHPEMNVPFAAFAASCISAQITDAVRQASRKKHQLLNQSYQQIAANLNVPAKTVDNALRRARRKFLTYRKQAQQAVMKNRGADA